MVAAYHDLICSGVSAGDASGYVEVLSLCTKNLRSKGSRSYCH